MEPLDLTVVIPLYNQRDAIAKCVASVQRQVGAAAAHTLVVDDASSDGSADAAAALGCEVIRLEDNGGAAAARNVGLHAAQTAWVAFLDSDDEWHPDLLTTLWPATERHVLVSGAAYLRTGDRVKTLLGPTSLPGTLLGSPRDALVPANPVVTSATMVKRELADGLGGFDTSLRYSEDLDLWLRLLEHGTGWCDARPVMTYHRVASSKSQEAHGGVESAREEIVRRYTGRPWWSGADCDRYLGHMYYEGARNAARSRAWGLAARHLGRSLRGPRRIQGVVQSLDRHRRLRRRAAQAA
jgi:glycosyltransferase involved in cell wall biosynthesis